MPKLYSQDRRLNRIQTRVPTLFDVDVLLSLSVVPQAAHAIRKLSVVGDHHASVATRAEVLRGIETETSGQAERPDGTVAVAGAVRLARVLDHHEPVLARS